MKPVDEGAPRAKRREPRIDLAVGDRDAAEPGRADGAATTKSAQALAAALGGRGVGGIGAGGGGGYGGRGFRMGGRNLFSPGGRRAWPPIRAEASFSNSQVE